MLDPATRQLERAGRSVELEPRTFDVLWYLLEHRDRVVPKEELLDEIWGDRFVGDSALTTRVKHARAAVGDDGRAQHTIKTVHRVGYRFVADVHAPSDDHDVDPLLAAGSGAAPGSVPRPTDTSWSSSWSSPPPRSVLGRAADLRAVSERLARHRLVTVTGTAGVGKSSLCRWLLTRTAPTASWFCELADARAPDAIADVVLAAIGEMPHTDVDAAESTLRILEDRAATLVLDNCEHLTRSAAELAERILARCPNIRIVATSREPLGVAGESIYALAPLELDAAVECFVERATDAGATVDPADLAVRELCRRLDGVPLAIELAAARARLLGPEEMLALLPERFRLLRDSDPSDPRHSSLHAALSWSWDSLELEDRRLLDRAGVFVGSFTLDDLRHVALDGVDPLDAVDALERLVRRSLVVALPGSGGRSRFRLLESVREYALAHVDDLEAVRRAHVEHFVGRAEALDAANQTDDVDRALAELGEIWVNVRAAVAYASAAGDTRSVRRLLVAVAQYAELYSISEVLDWSEHAGLDGDLSDDPDVALGAAALAVRARTLAHQGRHQPARALADRAWELHESHATLLAVVWSAYYTGDLDRVVGEAPRLAALSRSAHGLDRGYAEGFGAIVAAVRQVPVIGVTDVTPAHVEGGVLGVLAVLTEGLRLCAADPQRAAELLEAVVDRCLRDDFRLLLGAAASTLTQITLPARPRVDAMATLRRTLTRYRERGMWNLIAADAAMAARLLADAGDLETAARLLGAREASGYSVGLSEVLALLLRDELRAVLGPDHEALVEQGRRWRLPEAADRAIAALGEALRGAGAGPDGSDGSDVSEPG